MANENNTTCVECNSGISQCQDCTPQTLSPLEPCASGVKCTDVQLTDCVLYSGTPVTCNSQVVLTTNTDLTTIIQNLYTALCDGGMVGSQGPQGDPGPAPVITVNPTVTISNTPTVTSVETSPGHYTMSFALPKGQDGVVPSIIVNNVSTGNAGTQASVTLDPTSTSSVKKFNFVIPRGNTGVQGSTGVGFTTAIVNGSGDLILGKSDSTTINAGHVKGANGLAGADGYDGAPGSNSLIYKYDSSLAEGKVTLNSTILSAVVSVTISKTSMIDYNGQTATTNNAAGWLSNIAVGDTFQIYKAVGSAYGIYTVSGITTNSTSYILTVSPVSANGNISAGTNIALSYSVKGEQGDPGLNGVDGKRGALGSNDLVYNWMSATNPGGFVGNSTNYSGITTLQINTTSLQGYTNAVATSYNAIAWLDNIKENSIISISDIDASDRFGVYKVSSVTHTESVYTFTVSVLAANGTVDSGQPSHAVGYVKSGSNGNYVDVEDVAPGAGCTYGGVKVTVYDGDTNAVLTTRYICGAEALTPVTPHCWMDFYNDGSNIHLNMLDSGWLNLQGFAHQASQTYRPQVRRIGNVLKFRGSIIVPLEDPQNSANQAIPGVGTYASVAGYHLIGYSKTFTGTGGCTIDTNGAIIFNEGNPVIPIGITSNNFYLERPYVLPFQICDRSIHTGGTKNSTTKIITPGATYGGSLSTVLRLIILADGTMKATTIQDLEQPASAGTTYTGGSSLRTIISKVSETDYVPKFNSSSTNLHGFTTSGSAQNVVVNTNTNGTWLIDFDGGDPSSLGGVIINLDGVVVLLDECIISYA